MARSKTTLFAILRFDGYLDEVAEIHERVTVTSVVDTAELAEQEVLRLSKLMEGKDVTYRWQTTRHVTGLE